MMASLSGPRVGRRKRERWAALAIMVSREIRRPMQLRAFKQHESQTLEENFRRGSPRNHIGGRALKAPATGHIGTFDDN